MYLKACFSKELLEVCHKNPRKGMMWAWRAVLGVAGKVIHINAALLIMLHCMTLCYIA